jgi:hypothetical protein
MQKSTKKIDQYLIIVELVKIGIRIPQKYKSITLSLLMVLKERLLPKINRGGLIYQ